jgi:hypothetical protein
MEKEDILLFNDEISSIDNSVITTVDTPPQRVSLSSNDNEDYPLDRDIDSILDASLAILEDEISES